MPAESLAPEIERRLRDVPLLDVHTHLVDGNLCARGLHDLVLYHMLVSELYAAGCPSGARLTQYPAAPAPEESRQRILEALPFLPFTRSTSLSWALRMTLRDLYGWTEPITAANWLRLDAIVRERAGDRSWQRSILGRANVQRNVTELARRGVGSDDDQLQHSLEWAMFTRCQWGEYDTALYELERTWGRQPESPTPIGGRRPPTDRTVRSLADVHAAVAHYVAVLPYDRIVSMALGVSTNIAYRTVSDAEMEAAIANRARAGVLERDVYASYINEAFLAALEARRPGFVYQFSIGAEPLPHETSCLVRQETVGQVAEMIARHPKLKFVCTLAGRHVNQAFCSLVRELPNFILAGYWWHSFFPDAIRQVMAERLDMLPLNRQIGFFSDAYCVEWVYAKALLVRKCMAQVLAERVAWGQYSHDEALGIAREVFFETPQTAMGVLPRGDAAGCSLTQDDGTTP